MVRRRTQDRRIQLTIPCYQIFDCANFVQEHLSNHNSVIRGVKNISVFEQMKDRREQANKEEEERAMRETEMVRREEEVAKTVEEMNLASQIMSEINRKDAKIKEERERKKRTISGSLDLSEVVPDPVIASPSTQRQVALDTIVKGHRIGKGMRVMLSVPVDWNSKRLLYKGC